MSPVDTVLIVMAVALGAVAVHAWRLGNERRDVALLGAIGGLFGVGAAVSVLGG